MSNKRIYTFLADGFEEIEAITPTDIWKRIGFEVITVGVNGKQIKGAHGIIITADIEIDEVAPESADAIFLPGGMPGSVNLRDNDKVIEIIQKVYSENKIVSAICAAPIALAKAGILENKKFTCYPSFEKEINEDLYTNNMVEVTENIVTGKGPGAAFEFAETVASQLQPNNQKINEVLKGMLIKEEYIYV
jgi:4-methyl-5(b-hydroxyethyl)-thiazole monophosphate biosynthesis